MSTENKTISPRDWPEDFGGENGNYQNRCRHCKELFWGHKRRVTCKTCTVVPTMTNLDTLFAEIAERIARREHYVTEELAPLKRVVEAAELATYAANHTAMLDAIHMLREALAAMGRWELRINDKSISR